jgi:hypothetical protein
MDIEDCTKWVEMNLQCVHIQQSSQTFKTGSTLSKHSPYQLVHYHRFHLHLTHRRHGGAGTGGEVVVLLVVVGW